MTQVVRIIKKLHLQRVVKHSFLYKLYIRSAGNPLYPIYATLWTLGKFLQRRKLVNLNGITLSLPVRNWVTHFRWYLIKQKEPEVRDWVDQCLNSDDTLIDIGGNMALISMYAAKRHLGMKIVCLEPEYSNLNLIKENLKCNKLMNSIDIYALGVSDFTGLSHLHIQDDEEGAAAHSESKEAISHTSEGYKVVWREGIAVYTLDEICLQLKISPTALKIDTDGNELKILQGAVDTLKSPNLKNVIIETPAKEDSQKMESMLTAYGLTKKNDTKPNSLNQIWNK